MDIHLHIGWHKTGTTAIQKFLVRNQEEVLRRLGANYPSAGRHRVAHNLPAWGLQLPLRAAILEQVGCRATPEDLFKEMLEETAAAGADSMLVSSEEFSPIHRYSLERLASIFKGHRVIVIAYVRRQDEHIESVYNQMVKFARSRMTKKFVTFVGEQVKGERLNYYRYFRQWAAVFGRENLRIRVYKRSRFRSGDVRRDFCEIMGLEEDGLAFDAMDANESLDPDSVRFLARFNTVPLTDSQHQQVVEALREFAVTEPRRSESLLTSEARAHILSRFADSNARFGAEFLDTKEPFDRIEPAVTAHCDLDETRFMQMLAFVMSKLLGYEEAPKRRRRSEKRV